MERNFSGFVPALSSLYAMRVYVLDPVQYHWVSFHRALQGTCSQAEPNVLQLAIVSGWPTTSL